MNTRRLRGTATITWQFDELDPIQFPNSVLVARRGVGAEVVTVIYWDAPVMEFVSYVWRWPLERAAMAVDMMRNPRPPGSDSERVMAVRDALWVASHWEPPAVIISKPHFPGVSLSDGRKVASRPELYRVVDPAQLENMAQRLRDAHVVSELTGR